MMIKAKNLHKVYKLDTASLAVLKGIDLEIKKGEFVSLLGASGAGKSTLLHLLGGLDLPTEGEVLLGDLNIYKIKDEERAAFRNRNIGFVFQFYHLLPEFTAIENVMLPGQISGMRPEQAREKAASLLDQVGLAQRIAHYPQQLSGGEQQRVAIARALINNPGMLFCDEPTGNLDSQTGGKICELIARISRENKITVLIATHSQDIAGISHKVLFVKDGRLADRN